MAGAWRWITAFVVLGLATLAITGHDRRFEAAGPPLADLSRFDVPDGTWYAAGPVTVNADGWARLSGAGPHPYVLLGRGLPDSNGAGYIRVDVEWRSRDLVRENPSWPAAGIAVQHINERGERLWFWPWRILDAPLATSDQWQRAVGQHPLFTEASTRRLFAYVASSSGSLDIRSITIQAVRETTGFRIARLTVTALWVLGGLAVLGGLLHTRHRRVMRLPAILAGTAIVIAGVMPQPHLAYTVGHLVDTAREARTLAGSLLTGGQSAPDVGPATSGQPADARADEAQAANDPQGANEGKTPDDDAPGGDTDGEGKEDPGAADAGTGNDQSDSEDPRGEDSAPQPSPPVPDSQRPLAQGVGHAIAFFFLTLAALFGWRGTPGFHVATGVALLSPAVQTLQTLVATRNAAAVDIAFDLTGVACAMIAWSVVARVTQRLRATPLAAP